MTDLQIERLILDPEIKRAKATNPKNSGDETKECFGFEEQSDLETPPSEEVFVSDWQKRFGNTAEYWREQYRMNYGSNHAAGRRK